MLKKTEKIEKEENLVGKIFEEIIINMDLLNKNNIDNFLAFMIDNENNIERQALRKLGNINVYLFILQIDTICIKFFCNTEDNQELIEFQLNSEAKYITNHHIAIESIRSAIKYCNNMLEEKGWKNSGLKFKSIERISFLVTKFSSNIRNINLNDDENKINDPNNIFDNASSYILTPEYLKYKKYLLNIQNEDDNNCLMWCVLVHFTKESLLKKRK